MSSVNLCINPVDRCVGRRLRELRERLHHTHAFLASIMDATAEQVERYESGLERIGAERLRRLAHELRVPPSYFFEGWTAAAIAS
jgi:transcriptional regulator with XRE-family HTH domain